MKVNQADPVLDTDAIQKELTRLLKEVGELAERVAGSVGSAGLEGPLRDGLHTLKGSVESGIKQKPLASLLLAFIAGVVLWALVAR